MSPATPHTKAIEKVIFCNILLQKNPHKMRAMRNRNHEMEYFNQCKYYRFELATSIGAVPLNIF